MKRVIAGCAIAAAILAVIALFWQPAWDAIGRLLDRPVSIGFLLLAWFWFGSWYEKAQGRVEKMESAIQRIEQKVDSLCLVVRESQ